MSNNREYNDNEMKLRQDRKKKVESFHLELDDNVLDKDFSNTEKPRKKSTDNNRKPSPPITDSQELNSFSGGKTRRELQKNMQKADKRQKKEAKKREKRKAKKNKRVFTLIWLIMVVMAGVVLSKYLLTGINDMLAISRPEDNQVKIKIAKEDKFEDIVNKLESSGVINDPEFFKLYAHVVKAEDHFEAGTFTIKTNLDYEAIISYLEEPYEVEKTVTVQITEGMSIVEIADLLADKGVTSNKDDFLDMCNSDEFDKKYDFIKKLGKANDNGRYYKLEGYLYPDTYTFYENEDPSMTVSRMLSNFAEKNVNTLAKADGYSDKVSIQERAEDTGYSFDQILTIASLIQAEAADEKDMYYVSSILYNRLNSGNAYDYSKLSLDSTVYYPYRDAKSVPKSMGGSNFKSTYDTYNFVGLPIGPICNPGEAALEAAINPKKTDYYYFCHNSETGEAYYASSFDEHQYNMSLAGVL
ncbi:MAG: endolytic transglycosylase MltG [Ruminococcus sp.]|nr:endolytic transglycosylase MltG [Ruminococcus sp.]